MSAKKDAMVQMGAAVLQGDDSMLDVYTECRTLCVVQEGFPDPWRPGGGDMERLAVGLRDGMRQDWLAYRIGQVQYLVDGLEAIGWCASRRGPCGLRGCGQAAAPHPGGSVPGPRPWPASSTRSPASARWR